MAGRCRVLEPWLGLFSLFFLPVTESATFRETDFRALRLKPKSLDLWEHVWFYLLFIYLSFPPPPLLLVEL